MFFRERECLVTVIRRPDLVRLKCFLTLVRAIIFHLYLFFKNKEKKEFFYLPLRFLNISNKNNIANITTIAPNTKGITPSLLNIPLKGIVAPAVVHVLVSAAVSLVSLQSLLLLLL